MLYRCGVIARATKANITSGVLQRISDELELHISPQEFFAYFYCILAGTTYGNIFSEELGLPGPRLPITKDPKLFRHAAEIGGALVWLHTFGRRFDAVPSLPEITL